MRFDCDKKEAHLSQWHSWFAWHPVRIGQHDCRWLERVERKGKPMRDWDGTYWDWEYRARPSTEGE